jgi:hypothetical protein
MELKLLLKRPESLVIGAAAFSNSLPCGQVNRHSIAIDIQKHSEVGTTRCGVPTLLSPTARGSPRDDTFEIELAAG